MTMGIRAHPDMNWTRCSWSIFDYKHVEFLHIWLFVFFALYMWVQVFLILFQVKYFYDLPKEVDYMLIFLVTFGIASSLTVTAVYLIYYPISKTMKARLETINL